MRGIIVGRPPRYRLGTRGLVWQYHSVEFRTRLAEPSDADAIAAVHVTAWQAAYRGIVPDQYLDALDVGERAAIWTAILSGEVVVEGVREPANYVVEARGDVVGFANVGQFRDRSDHRHSGELWAMYVAPKQWGTGAADALMATTLDYLADEGFTQSYLWVFEGNERARRFYRRHGWVIDELIKNFELDDATVCEVRYSRQAGR